jgi:hypothetical protein
VAKRTRAGCDRGKQPAWPLVSPPPSRQWAASLRLDRRRSGSSVSASLHVASAARGRTLGFHRHCPRTAGLRKIPHRRGNSALDEGGRQTGTGRRSLSDLA